MNQQRVMSFTVAAISFISMAMHAETVKLKATLSGAQEVPAKQTAASGNVTATYDTATRQLHYHVIYEGLTGPVTAAHFHGPAAEGSNAKPQVPVKTPFDSPIDGDATLSDEQATDLLASKWYFNLHTAANPGGEVRGQVVKE